MFFYHDSETYDIDHSAVAPGNEIVDSEVHVGNKTLNSFSGYAFVNKNENFIVRCREKNLFFQIMIDMIR